MALRVRRRRLVATATVRAELVRWEGIPRAATAECHEPETQLLVTLAGAFVYHVGRARRFVDANRVAFVRAGQSSRDSAGGDGAVECLVLTPSCDAVDGALLPQTAPATVRLQLAAARLAARAAGDGAALARDALEEDALARDALARDALARDALARDALEEDALALVHEALAAEEPARAPRPAAALRLAERAKALLSPEGPPIALPALARRLSVSPAYLTDAFRRAEGLPLVRYQQRLRLTRALAELPRRDDLTALALDLGFSSHSHFTTAFRATMGLTPSEFRRQARGRAIQRT